MPIYKRWTISRPVYNGILTESDFEVEEDHTVDLRKGEILCRALFISVDPITRLYISYGMEPGDTIPARQVARVIESKNRDFPKARLVYGSLGWQTYTTLQPNITQEMCGHKIPLVEGLPRQIEQSGGLPKSAALSILGIPGLSAYFGLFQTCKITGGEVVVISSAAGQIGHIAGQIAGKILGCRVIGFTGDAEKASWIKTELGFDWAFNYKTQDVSQTLKIAAPDGVDIFLDSVGGIFGGKVMEHMRYRGRVCIFGNLSAYNNPSNVPMVPSNDLGISLKELTIVGFNVYRYWDKVDEALDQLSEWAREGQIISYEHSIEGFENLPTAFIDQLAGISQGKVIVRV